MTEPSRRLIIVANWKMNTTPADAADLAIAIADATSGSDVVRVICPPYVCLAAVRDILRGRAVEIGAQNVHAEVAGAHTGEISAPMLAGLAGWCIVGHSERRRDQGETDELVGRKLLRCRESGLRPILCVGERLEEREAGDAEVTVRGQLERSFAVVTAAGDGIDPALVVAYEPVWAIGTGRTARGSDARAMAATIRETLAGVGAPDGATSIPVLYGGSVTSGTIGEFLAEPSIDGALVGGASLKVEEMRGIVGQAASAAHGSAWLAPITARTEASS
jgi:triosephosphate isomerase (TIM)